MSNRLSYFRADANLDYVKAANHTAGRFTSSLYSGTVNTCEELKYLGEIRLKASPDATGTFTVALQIPDTWLADANSQPLDWTAANTVLVTVVP